MDEENLKYVNTEGLLSIKNRPNVVVIDVRDHERKSDGHIAGSIHHFSVTFPLRLRIIAESIKDKDIVIFYCVHSKRRGPACARDLARYLQNVARERKKIAVLEHGFSGWESLGYPVCHCTDVPCRVVDETKARDIPRVAEGQAQIPDISGMIEALLNDQDVPYLIGDQAPIPPESQQPEESESNTDIDPCSFLNIPEVPDSPQLPNSDGN